MCPRAGGVKRPQPTRPNKRLRQKLETNMHQAEGSQCVWIAEPSQEPLEIPTRNGMTISADGVLLRSADCAKRSKQYRQLEFGLRELAKHIEELRSNPTPEAVGEFLSLWT